MAARKGYRFSFCELNGPCTGRSIYFNVSELWSKNFNFNSKTQRQMFLLCHGRHVCAPLKGTNMASPYKALLIFPYLTKLGLFLKTSSLVHALFNNHITTWCNSKHRWAINFTWLSYIQNISSSILHDPKQPKRVTNHFNSFFFSYCILGPFQYYFFFPQKELTCYMFKSHSNTKTSKTKHRTRKQYNETIRVECENDSFPDFEASRARGLMMLYLYNDL